EELTSYPSYLDARIRHRRVQSLMDSIVGVTEAQVADTSFIPGDAVVREFVGGSTIKIPHND
ncbi:hypothetical protein KAH43_02650, partial [Candidatus Bipolaricaulota bacterium]|nr:hypothetical protein [Candidatus Bipolaricaulota bacterium]